MKISILTLFPEMFQGPFNYSIVKRAVDKGLINLNFVNIRDYGIGKHHLVDDKPYGGGNGMILKVDVINSAIKKAKDKKLKNGEERIILLSAKGKTYEQSLAKKYAKLKHLIIICGHYEGIDERILNFVDEEVSIGDYILTGGEIPAMIIADSVSRLVKGVIREGSAENESFTPFLEYPQFTKPQQYKNFPVPEILLSGNHKQIDSWRKKESLITTSKIRPDLLKK
jgi:tRNA (guanine37-N1)-methyltransferase